MIGWAALASAAIIACPVENAHYALRHTPGVTAYFRDVDSGPDWPGGVALAVHVRRTGVTTWWLPWRGGSDNLQNLASTTDVRAPGWKPPSPDGGPRPLGNREYLGADARYTIIDDIPLRGGPAPAHMLIPTGGSSRETVFLAKQFFDLVKCSGPGGQRR